MAYCSSDPLDPTGNGPGRVAIVCCLWEFADPVAESSDLCCRTNNNVIQSEIDATASKSVETGLASDYSQNVHDLLNFRNARIWRICKSVFSEPLIWRKKKKKKKNQTQRNQILPIIGVILLSRAREGSRFTNFASFHERKLREKSFSFYFLLIDASAIDRCFNNRGSTVRAISLNNRLVNETINKQKKIIIINLTENSTRIDALKF